MPQRVHVRQARTGSDPGFQTLKRRARWAATCTTEFFKGTTMTRDHLLGFPALLRQHDEPVVPKEQTVKERPAAFVAFEKGDLGAALIFVAALMTLKRDEIKDLWAGFTK